jgi:hypothetical protein
MLGNGDGNGGQIEALGGDAIDELLGRIAEGARGVDDTDGGNGSGDGSGKGGNGSGDGGGDDPLKGVPVDARMLIDSIKQVCDFCAKLVDMTTDRETALIERLMALVERSEARTLQQALELLKAEVDARHSLTPILVRRFEAIEHNLTMIGKHLGATYEGDGEKSGDAEDAGSGP